ncbi:MAG: lytic transglycosylase domain-containing protein [Desulfovibrio sp.]|jgi:soluble lytic murein transglycosylase-like protein|nr:lytic transglycosylase domain-containing protein [Desulfovibrio sp.]
MIFPFARLTLPTACAALLFFVLAADFCHAKSRPRPLAAKVVSPARNSAEAPLRESAAWQEGVARLQSYREGRGQAPPPLRLNIFTPARPSTRVAFPPLANTRPNPRPFFTGGFTLTGPRPQGGQSVFAPDWENITLFAGRRHGVDPTLIKAVLQIESNFNPRAVSPKGALGAMQIMPDTGRELGLTDFFDPAANTEAGTRYLAAMLRVFPSLELSLAAYNAGPGAVQHYGTVPPYAETRDYVVRVLEAYRKLSSSGSK